jgi:predicted RNase H-like HicB family nuclease
MLLARRATMRQYIALIQASPDYGLAAKLPDFPGLLVVAKTLDKLRELLTQDVAAHTEALQRKGIVWPEPSSFESLMADPSNRECAAMLVWARGSTQVAARVETHHEALHAQSNDEWPEADA